MPVQPSFSGAPYFRSGTMYSKYLKPTSSAISRSRSTQKPSNRSFPNNPSSFFFSITYGSSCVDSTLIEQGISYTIGLQDTRKQGGAKSVKKFILVRQHLSFATCCTDCQEIRVSRKISFRRFVQFCGRQVNFIGCKTLRQQRQCSVCSTFYALPCVFFIAKYALKYTFCVLAKLQLH